MKIFILCGGFGTRLDYEGTLKAKPMVRIGKEPIIRHIIDNFCDQNFNEFVLCLGHKEETIKNYFFKENKNKIKTLKKTKLHSRVRFKLKNKTFFVDLVYTGKDSGTGGRIKIAYDILKLKEDIFMTYGDGLSNLSIKKLINFHYKHSSLVTMTAVRPKQRYGILKINNNKISFFDNSKKKSDVYINGGFFVISNNAMKYIKNFKTYWEREPINYIKKKKKLFAYKHNGFWQSMDTMKDKNDLNYLYRKNKFLWKIKKYN